MILHDKRIKLIAAFAAIFLIWGSTYLAVKYAIEAIPPFLMMGIRCVIAGLILYFWNRWREDERAAKEHVIPLIIIGTLFFLGGFGLQAWAQQKIPTGLTALLIASQPLWIATIESFVVKADKATPRMILGLMIGFLGIGLLIAPWQGLGNQQLDSLSVLAILVGAVSWSAGSVYSRVAKLPKSPALSAGLELIVGGVLLIICGLLLGEGSQFHLHELTIRSLLGLMYLIIFGSIITFTAYIWLLSVAPATRVGTHAYINPVIAVFLGWAIAGESLSLQIFVATIIIVISVYLVLGPKRKVSLRVNPSPIRNAEA